MKLTGKTLQFSIIGAGVLAGVGFATFRAYAGPQEGIIAEGVKVAGMDWGGKSVATARAELEGWSKARTTEALPLTIVGDKPAKSWKPTRAELGAEVDADATIAKAEEASRDDAGFARVLSWFNGRKSATIEPVWKTDEAKLRKYLRTKVAPAARREERNARFVATGDSYSITPGRPGTSLDLDASVKKVAERLTAENPDPIELPVKTVEPHVSSADLRGIEGEISRFQTHYSERGNRAKNIQVACSHINGTVLKPGDVFSYNKTVGPREAEGGFKLAPVIVKGKLVPGMGGGVCQTSTTLYNAVLLAGLKIEHRSHHAFPVHYVPPGRDATVAYGSLDFQFKNDSDAPIAIASSGAGGQVVMRIYGKKVPGRTVQIERTNVSSWGQGSETVTDGTLAAGVTRTLDKGHAGHRVTVWRKIFMNGQLVKNEQVSRDVYKAFPRVVAVGRRQVARRTDKAVTPAPDAGTTQTPPPTLPAGGADGQQP